VIEPRKLYNRGQWITAKVFLSGKADVLSETEGSRLICVKGEYDSHHRGLRAGHELKRVIWELGRTLCFLVKHWNRAKQYKIARRGSGSPPTKRALREDTKKRANKVSMTKRKRRALRRA